MSALPFDINALAPAERPSTEALNRGFSASHAAMDFYYRQELAQRTNVSNSRATLRDGFMGDGFMTRAINPASMFVEVSPGLGFRYDPSNPLVVAQDTIVGVYQGVTDLSPYRPLVLPQAVTFPVPAAPLVGQSRYDIIEVRPKRQLADYGNLLRFNFGTLQWAPQSAAAFLRYGIESAEIAAVVSPALSTAPLSYVQGVAAATGTQVEPPGTPGYITIARILVNGGDTSIPQSQIVDRRVLANREQSLLISGSVEIDLSANLPFGTPTLKYLSAPPSVDVAVITGDVTMAGLLIVIFVGKAIRGSSLQLLPYSNVGVAGEPVVAWGHFKDVIGVVDSAFSALLADPAFTSPAGPRAVGQRYVAISIGANQFNPATQLFNKTLPTLFTYDFSAEVLV